MNDIVKAIERETKYLSYRMRGEEPFHLVDAVKECGFDSLTDYFKAKKKYTMSQLEFEVREPTADIAIADIHKVMNEKRTAVLLVRTEHTFVWNGDNSTFNEGYCNECSIPIYPLNTRGGTIVSTKGDLSIGICVPESIGIDVNYLLNELADIFRKHTDKHISVDGNDVLVDGFKVLGSTTYKSNGMFMFVAIISLTEKSELISKICTKHSVKTPAYIDFLTCDELEHEIRKWLKL